MRPELAHYTLLRIDFAVVERSNLASSMLAVAYNLNSCCPLQKYFLLIQQENC